MKTTHGPMTTSSFLHFPAALQVCHLNTDKMFVLASYKDIYILEVVKAETALDV